MATILFNRLKIGDNFIYNNQAWVKVTPKKKTCCTILYNAHMVGNKKAHKIFKQSDNLEKIEPAPEPAPEPSPEQT